MDSNIEMINATAASQWAAATSNQKTVIRIGMIPKELHDDAVTLLGDLPDFHRLHAVALFACARNSGGMRA